jgi:hypothetical protein
LRSTKIQKFPAVGLCGIGRPLRMSSLWDESEEGKEGKEYG